jgi:hypothetical protein
MTTICLQLDWYMADIVFQRILLTKSRMRELRTSGSGGAGAGNRPVYPTFFGRNQSSAPVSVGGLCG